MGRDPDVGIGAENILGENADVDLKSPLCSHFLSASRIPDVGIGAAEYFRFEYSCTPPRGGHFLAESDRFEVDRD